MLIHVLIQLMVVNTLFAMLTGYLVHYFLKTNFNIRSERTRLVVFIICFGLLDGLLSTLCMKYLPDNLQFLKSFFLLILSIAVITYILKISMVRALLSFCTIMLVVMLCNFLAPLVFAFFSNVNVTPDVIAHDIFLFAVMNALVYFFTSIIILLTPFAKKLGRFKNLKPVIILLIITLLMLVLNAGIHYIVSFDPISFTATLILSLIYLIVSVWYINNFYKYEMKIEEEKQQAFYNESLSLVIQDLRRFKHDQANHLTVISAMLKMKKYDQANSYINEMFNTTESIVDTTICDIKNAGLFGLISSKMDNAKKTGIKFSLQALGEIDSIPNVKISELCEIIGIYLDNAIEAAAISDAKEVGMLLENKEESIDITIDNSCSTAPNLDSIKLDGYSTKGNNRGHGLSIVDKILSNYDSISNIINFDNKNMTFTQMLKIKKGI